MKDLVIAEELLEEIKKSKLKLTEIGQTQSITVDAGSTHITSLKNNIIKSLSASETPDIDKFSICLDVMLLELNSYLVGHSQMNQTFGKLATLTQIEEYLENKVAMLGDEERTAARILKTAGKDSESISEKRSGIGSRPEKLKNVRNLKKSLSESNVD